jgi:hypothetical protein
MKRPLILTDLEQMKLFIKLTEKTSTDDEPSKLMLSRQQIPNFYKNLNVAYSWKIRLVMNKILSKHDERFNLFNDNFFGFYLEIVEPGEVYILKNEKSQIIISKKLNNIDLKKMSNHRYMDYMPLNGRKYSEVEKMWVNVLNSHFDRTYSLAYIVSYLEFELRIIEFMHNNLEKESKANHPFETQDGFKLNQSAVKTDSIALINIMKRHFGNFRFEKWKHWEKDRIDSSGEKYMTMRERFELENREAGEITKNIEK